VSEVKLWGRGGSWARHRSVACKGRQFARRDFHRAYRKAARVALAAYADDVVTFAPVIDDHDAHVEVFESRFCSCGPYWGDDFDPFNDVSE
jgi:hypothetical protein